MATIALALPFRGSFSMTQGYGHPANVSGYEPPGHGYTHWHQGVDWQMPCGTPLYAAGAGTVYHNSYESGSGYGANMVTIDHGQGVTSLYGHLSRKDVIDGQTVQQGDQIGLSGGGTGDPSIDGTSTGCHLHWGVLLDGWHDVDPTLYLSGQGPTGTAAGTPLPAVLTPEQAAYYARNAGVPEDQLATAVAIAMAESGLIVGAVSPVNTDGSRDYGLWQISVSPTKHTQYDTTQLTTDPSYNASAMVDISDGGLDWTPWTTYGYRGVPPVFVGWGQGAYRDNLTRAQQAVASPASHTAPDFVDAGSSDTGGPIPDVPQDTTPQQSVLQLYIQPVTERFDLCVRRRGQESWLGVLLVKIAGYWLPVIDASVTTTQYLTPGRFQCTLGLDDVRRRSGNDVEHALYEQGWQQVIFAAGYCPPRIVNGQTVPDLRAIGGPDALPVIFTGIVTGQRPVHSGAQRRMALSGGDLSTIASAGSSTNSSFASTLVNQSGFTLVKSLWLAHNPKGFSGLSIKGSGTSTTVGGIFGQNAIQTRQTGRTEWQAMVQAAQAEGAVLYMDGSTLVYGPIPTPPPALFLPVDVPGVTSVVESVEPEINPHSKRDYKVLVNSFQTGDGSTRQAIGGNHDSTETATIWEHTNLGPKQLQQKANYYANFYAATEKLQTIACVEPVGVSRGQPLVLQSESLYSGFTDPLHPFYTVGVTVTWAQAAGLRQSIQVSSRPLAVLGTEQVDALAGGL